MWLINPRLSYNLLEGILYPTTDRTHLLIIRTLWNIYALANLTLVSMSHIYMMILIELTFFCSFGNWAKTNRNIFILQWHPVMLQLPKYIGHMPNFWCGQYLLELHLTYKPTMLAYVIILSCDSWYLLLFPTLII